MRFSGLILCLLMTVLAGCQPASAPAYRTVTMTLPGDEAELESLADGDVLRLDLSVGPPLTPSLSPADPGGEGAGCAFGVIEAESVSIPTGSYHLLLEARLGTVDANPASLLSCEYDASLLGEDPPGVRWRLRGCFLARSVAVPTAISWHLMPLGAQACGIGD